MECNYAFAMVEKKVLMDPSQPIHAFAYIEWSPMDSPSHAKFHIVTSDLDVPETKFEYLHRILHKTPYPKIINRSFIDPVRISGAMDDEIIQVPYIEHDSCYASQEIPMVHDSKTYGMINLIPQSIRSTLFDIVYNYKYINKKDHRERIRMKNEIRPGFVDQSDPSIRYVVALVVESYFWLARKYNWCYRPKSLLFRTESDDEMVPYYYLIGNVLDNYAIICSTLPTIQMGNENLFTSTISPIPGSVIHKGDSDSSQYRKICTM